MADIEIETKPELRRNEAGTITIRVPETKNLKSLKVDVPPGVISPSGTEITLAPKMEYVDIPILVTEEANEEFKIGFQLVEKTKRKRKKKIEALKEFDLKIKE